MTYEEFVEKLKVECEKYNFTESTLTTGMQNYKAFCYGGKTYYEVPGDELRSAPMVLVYQDKYDNMRPKIDYDELMFYTTKAGTQTVKCKTKTNVLKLDKFNWYKLNKWLIDQNQLVQQSLLMYKQRSINKKLKKVQKDF